MSYLHHQWSCADGISVVCFFFSLTCSVVAVIGLVFYLKCSLHHSFWKKKMHICSWKHAENHSIYLIYREDSGFQLNILHAQFRIYSSLLNRMLDSFRQSHHHTQHIVQIKTAHSIDLCIWLHTAIYFNAKHETFTIDDSYRISRITFIPLSTLSIRFNIVFITQSTTTLHYQRNDYPTQCQ